MYNILFFFSAANATTRPRLRKAAVPSQNLPVRMFDKVLPERDVRKERRKRREALAADQAEESEWLQSLWSGHLTELVTTETSDPDVTTAVHEEPTTVADQPTG